MSRVLVTGGYGFIGSALVRRLVADGNGVLNVDAETYAGLSANVADCEGAANYRFEHADIRDGSEIARLMADFAPDAVMHLAAETHVDRSIDDPMDFLSTNVLGTASLLRATEGWLVGQGDGVRDKFRFLQISTDEVYGALGPTGSFSETTPLVPNSPYAASKAAGDHLARAWLHTWKLPVMVCRSSNNFGPCQFPEKLIPRTIISALEGRDIEVYAKGENVRDWIYVDDNVDALLAVLDKGTPGETYNIGAGCERRNIDLVNDICGILKDLTGGATDAAGRISFVTDRPGHDFRYALDTARLAGEIGWAPATAHDEALRRTVAWYLENRDWWEKLAAKTYDGGRLGQIST